MKFKIKTVFLALAVLVATSIAFLSFGRKANQKNVAEQTVKIIEKMTSEDLAKSLIKDVYYGVSFEEQSGKGYLKRYVCSNLCIDVLEGGRLRYLCDVTAKSAEDLFMKWLNKNESINIVERTEKYGIIYEKIEGKRIKGELYINPENKRVIAAEITIKYDE